MLDSVSASGPDMPKCVSSISPSPASYFFLPAPNAVSVTFLSDSPLSAYGHVSTVSIEVSAGSAGFVRCPVSSAMRQPSPVEPVVG